ncbi:MAG: hypothetical protein ACR2PF_07215 [Rhizobiaceae bacterium]
MVKADPSSDLAVIARIAKRMCIILLGYAAAVASATLVTLLFKPALLFSPAVTFGIIVTAIAASPSMLCFMAFSEIRYRVGPGGHILAGTLTALAAHGFLSMLGGFDSQTSELLGFSTLGGAIGGWSYWRLAVAHLQAEPATWYDSSRLSLLAK